MNRNPDLNPDLYFKPVAAPDHASSVRDIVASQNAEFEQKTAKLRALRLAAAPAKLSA